MLLFPVSVIDDTCTESQTTRVIYLNYIGISQISSCKACPRQYILLPPTRSPAVYPLIYPTPAHFHLS